MTNNKKFESYHVFSSLVQKKRVELDKEVLYERSVNITSIDSKS